jgi:hypothetical protein
VFAEVGSCITVDDAIAVQPTCLTRVALIGPDLDVAVRLGFTYQFWQPVPFPDELYLVIQGCGRDVSFRLPAQPPPRPTLDVDVVDRTITASWTTDVPAHSAYVSYGHGLGSTDCHSDRSPHEYVVPDGWPLDAYRYFGVTTFNAPEATERDGVSARIWRGGTAAIQRP